MNYRHAYHAGNHADVLKHIVLTRTLVHLQRKPKPVRVIDAHAGIGLYDLHGIEAGKTGEWEGGIGKMGPAFAPEIEDLLAPYRAVIAALNPHGGFVRYPGSPELVLRLLRAGDRLVANELHPEDHDRLAERYGADPRVTVTRVDALACIRASLPPAERRGLILIDPPYEAKDEARRAADMLRDGLRRFATGVFILWYPLKSDDTAPALLAASREIGIPATLQVELRVREAFNGGGLAGSGLIIVNTPWQLETELAPLAAALAGRLGLGSWGKSTVAWLVPPV